MTMCLLLLSSRESKSVDFLLFYPTFLAQTGRQPSPQHVWDRTRTGYVRTPSTRGKHLLFIINSLIYLYIYLCLSFFLSFFLSSSLPPSLPPFFLSFFFAFSLSFCNDTSTQAGCFNYNCNFILVDN